MSKDQILEQFRLEDNLILMQHYAAACLREYCKHKKISHPSLTELLNHFESFSKKSNVSEWEAYGATLQLNGRGDPIPEDLRLSLSGSSIDEFCYLVDCAVEVGIVDIYGARTELPLNFLNNIMKVLVQNEIPLPKVSINQP